MIHYLPSNIALQYSELLPLCATPLPSGSNLSFKKKTIRGKHYWYLYISLGSRRTEHYLGEESAATLALMESEQALWEQHPDDRILRSKLVAMLVAGGATAPSAEEGKVLALLEKSGVFLAGGVLVGTHAFQAYANMLGVQWSNHARTQDIDLARESRLPIALPTASLDVTLKDSLLESGMGFLEVPTLNRKAPSTSFRIRGKALSVDLLTPMVGSHSAPVPIPGLGAYAEPMRYIEYLLEETQLAVLLYRHGILVHLPNPARYALHKLVTSQRRPSAFATKSSKDIAQANALLEVLCQDRPGDVILAHEAALNMGKKFLPALESAIAQLDEPVRNLLKEALSP